MFTTHWRLSKTLLLGLILSSSPLCFGMKFFDRTVDFFGDGTPITEETSTPSDFEDQEKEGAVSSIRAGDAQPFDWSIYENPDNIQFWDAGGDYVPPRPWRYLMAHPSKENAQKYVTWLGKKMALTQQASKEIKALYAEQNKDSSSGEERAQASALKAAIKQVSTPNPPSASRRAIDWSHFNVAFFYQVKCPYCQKSESIFQTLKRLGASLVAVQLDWQQNPATIPHSLPYDSSLNAVFHVDATPTWILSSKVTNNQKRIAGYIPLEKLEQIAKSLEENH